MHALFAVLGILGLLGATFGSFIVNWLPVGDDEAGIGSDTD